MIIFSQINLCKQLTHNKGGFFSFFFIISFYLHLYYNYHIVFFLSLIIRSQIQWHHQTRWREWERRGRYLCPLSQHARCGDQDPAHLPQAAPGRLQGWPLAPVVGCGHLPHRHAVRPPLRVGLHLGGAAGSDGAAAALPGEGKEESRHRRRHRQSAPQQGALLQVSFGRCQRSKFK